MEWKGMSKKQQQNMIRLGLLALLGIALLLAGGRGHTAQEPKSEQTIQQGNSAVATQKSTDAVVALETQLAQTLAQIQGAGEVTVQITVNDLGHKEYARDLQKTERNTSEQSGDSNQQTTEVQESQTVVQQSGGQTGTGALLIEETMPEIRGVLIVATGANQAKVQEQLLRAAATVLQISTEKIIVLPGEGGTSYE